MDAAKPWMARRATSQDKLLTLPIRGVITVSNSNPDNIIFFAQNDRIKLQKTALHLQKQTKKHCQPKQLEKTTP